jgi:hypothetical protein
MSISREQRHENTRLALSLLLKCFGEDTMIGNLCDSADPVFKDVLPTTWLELERRGFVERTPLMCESTRYEFTGAGWYAALEVAGRLQDAGFVAKLGAIAKVLKSAVKDRREDAILYSDSVASEAGCSDEFIYNVIESRALDRCFNMQGAVWEAGTATKIIHVPADFGLPPL